MSKEGRKGGGREGKVNRTLGCLGTPLPLNLHHLHPSPLVSSSSCRHTIKVNQRDFPGGPVVKTSPSNAGGAGSIAGRGAKIPHASRPKNQNVKQSQYCNKFNKDLNK